MKDSLNQIEAKLEEALSELTAIKGRTGEALTVGERGRMGVLRRRITRLNTDRRVILRSYAALPASGNGS